MIRDMTRADFEAFWPEFERIIAAQETFAYAPDMGIDQAYELWCEVPQRAMVYDEDGAALGTYYLKPNSLGPASHVCNCGYMVSEKARGRGLARQLCEHSQTLAKQLGYQAMQFNSVVSTNEVAAGLWKKLGFAIVGRVPGAYRHSSLGDVDLLVMHKVL